MNTKEKKAALKSALSQRVKEGKLVVVNDLSVDEAKTKAFAEKVAGIGVEGKALLVDTIENTNARAGLAQQPEAAARRRAARQRVRRRQQPLHRAQPGRAASV